MDNRPIGIFDSGVGGLTAARQLVREAPHESFVYFGDTIRAPYGDRTAEDIRFLSRRNARFLRAQNVKALIVACNTSTANAMAELSADNADIPITGTVAPTAAQAVSVTHSGVIGVIATGATIRSGLYEKTVLELLPGARVISRACPRLVPLIEMGHVSVSDAALMDALREDLAPIRDAGADTLILGCTHYPLVSEAVTAVTGADIALVDSGAACVGAVLRALEERGQLADPSAVRSEKYFCSGRRDDFTAVARGFLGRDIGAMTHQIDVEGY